MWRVWAGVWGGQHGAQGVEKGQRQQLPRVTECMTGVGCCAAAPFLPGFWRASDARLMLHVPSLQYPNLPPKLCYMFPHMPTPHATHAPPTLSLHTFLPHYLHTFPPPPRQGFKGAQYWGTMTMDMSASSNSTFCLEMRNCKPLGGLSIWAAVPPMAPLYPDLPQSEVSTSGMCVRVEMGCGCWVWGLGFGRHAHWQRLLDCALQLSCQVAQTPTDSFISFDVVLV